MHVPLSRWKIDGVPAIWFRCVLTCPPHAFHWNPVATDRRRPLSIAVLITCLWLHRKLNSFFFSFFLLYIKTKSFLSVKNAYSSAQIKNTQLWQMFNLSNNLKGSLSVEWMCKTILCFLSRCKLFLFANLRFYTNTNQQEKTFILQLLFI